MNTLQLADAQGEINSLTFNTIPVNDVAGDAVLTLDAMDEGEAFPILVVINFPKIKPRVTVPNETRDIVVEARS
jgi:hypothetical protein